MDWPLCIFSSLKTNLSTNKQTKNPQFYLCKSSLPSGLISLPHPCPPPLPTTDPARPTLIFTLTTVITPHYFLTTSIHVLLNAFLQSHALSWRPCWELGTLGAKQSLPLPPGAGGSGRKRRGTESLSSQVLLSCKDAGAPGPRRGKVRSGRDQVGEGGRRLEGWAGLES